MCHPVYSNILILSEFPEGFQVHKSLIHNLAYVCTGSFPLGGSGGNILKTTDGGSSWQLIQTGFGKKLYRIKVFSEEKILTGGEMAGWPELLTEG